MNNTPLWVTNKMPLVTDFKLCLKAIEEGHFKSINQTVFMKKIEDDPAKLGDHVQFSLHKFCKQNGDKEVEEFVIKLSRLCFSKECATGFNNMDRFLGSLYHICSYFNNRNEFAVVLEISKSVEFKTAEIEKSALEQQTTRNFLYVLHSHFLTTAQRIAATAEDLNNSEKMLFSYELAKVSINLLNLIKMKLVELGRKLMRNFYNYVNNLKHFDKNRISDLYKMIEKALINLMPMYRDGDFFLYYIIKMDHAEGVNEMEHKNLIYHFRKCLEIFSVLTNDSKSMKYWHLILSEDPKSEEYFKNLILSVKKLGLQKNARFHLLIFSIFFNYIAQLWIKNYSDNWSEIMSAKIIQKLYNGVLSPMQSIFRNISDHCRPVEYQMDICFSDYYIMNYLKILHLIRLCLKFNITGCVDLVHISRECFSIVLKRLRVINNTCCLHRKKQSWNNLVFHYTNTIEGILRNPCANNCWEHMKNCSEELLCEIINSEFELPYEWKRVKILFQRWYYACLRLNEYDTALFVCTFYIITYPQEEEDALSMWIQAKLEMPHEIGKCVTLKDVIDLQEEKIKNMNSRFELSKLDLKRLLMKELMAYSSSSVSTVKCCCVIADSVLKAWNVLKDMELKPWERAAALNYVIGATISSADSESLKKYRRDCESLINDITNSRKNRDCRSLLYAGNLKYSLFLCHLKSVQDIEDKISASKSILEYLKKEEEEKIKFGEAVDMNLTCNVMPSSNHFTVTFESNHLNALNETFALWQEAIEIIEPSFLESYEYGSWLHNVKQISQMYYLIGDFNQSFLSWLLYYRIAKICSNRPCILLGLTQVISQYSSVENSTILEEAEEIAADLLASNKEKDIVISYWLAVASSYLKSKNEGKCFDYLCKTKNVIDSVRSISYISQARYWCLVSKFLCLYSDRMEKFGLKPHTEIRTVVFKSFGYANSAVRDGSVRTLRSTEYNEILLTMLEVNTWASTFFGVYHQTNFMRFFLDDLYQIFQKLVLPTRTAYVLMLLAEADVMCEKTEDGFTKLRSLKSILGTLSLPKEELKTDAFFLWLFSNLKSVQLPLEFLKLINNTERNVFRPSSGARLHPCVTESPWPWLGFLESTADGNSYDLIDSAVKKIFPFFGYLKKCAHRRVQRYLFLHLFKISTSEDVRFIDDGSLEEEVRQKKSGLLEVPVYSEDEKESPRAPSPARFLNVHDSTRERDPSPLRYVLNDVDLVKQLNHKPKCNCYTCRNLLIKLICVNVLLLEARLHQMNGLIKKSCLCYKEGYKNQKKLESYQLEQSESLFGVISKSVTGVNGFFDFHGGLFKVNSIKFLTNYALFMLSPSLKENMIEDVYKLIGKIDKIMLSLSYEYKLLQWQVMELKLMSFAVEEFRTEENEKEKLELFHNREASSPKPFATPLVSKNPRKNAAPVKYKQAKNFKTPNLFVSKPSGRKVFSDDEDKPVVSAEDVKSKNNRKKVEHVGEPRKRKPRTKVHALADVELLS